jgi:hypothetical protein
VDSGKDGQAPETPGPSFSRFFAQADTRSAEKLMTYEPPRKVLHQ